jgi:pimeloyl-ACP methyl ester carboxylesterase
LNIDEFQQKRTVLDTSYGPIGVTEFGTGAPAVFIHGVFMSGALWRHTIEGVSDLRRCIAIDMPAHGTTITTGREDLSLTGQARAIAAVCDALNLQQFDLVANDTGGAVAQVLIADDPTRIRTLTLTNCDAHDNLPPEAFGAAAAMAHAGDLAPFMQTMAKDYSIARSDLGFGLGFEHPETLSDDVISEYLQCVATPQRALETERYVASIEPQALLSAEPQLSKLKAPTLIVWGTGDVFFDVSWAHWLRDLIPSTRAVIEVDGAKLFFPDERPADLIPHLHNFWTGTAGHL